MKKLIVVEGEILEATEINENNIVTENGNEYIIFESREAAGEAAREYYKDLAENDKEEFICMVGTEALVDWCLGRYAGPGTEKVNSLEDWLDLWLDAPEDHFSHYDGTEIEDVRMNNYLANYMDIEDRTNVVMYRSN